LVVHRRLGTEEGPTDVGPSWTVAGALALKTAVVVFSPTCTGYLSTTVVFWPPWSLSRDPKPPQLDQKMSEATNPIAPTMTRMIPATCKSMPAASAVTAQARIAPTAIRMMLRLIHISFLLLPSGHGLDTRTRLLSKHDLPGKHRNAVVKPLRCPQPKG
jgi:hypothetical protein